LVDHLNDEQPQVRLMAARAAVYAGSDSAALLLRMKVLAGDAEPDVIAEAFAQLVKIQPAKSIDFLARFIDADDETIRQSALLALGESHRAEALAILTQRWADAFAAHAREQLVPAIAAHRSNEAVQFLIERLEQSGPELSLAIVEALHPFRRDESVRTRVQAIVHQRGDARLAALFARKFAQP
jgi:HEAT repeat protein